MFQYRNFYLERKLFIVHEWRYTIGICCCIIDWIIFTCVLNSHRMDWFTRVGEFKQRWAIQVSVKSKLTWLAHPRIAVGSAADTFILILCDKKRSILPEHVFEKARRYFCMYSLATSFQLKVIITCPSFIKEISFYK